MDDDEVKAGGQRQVCSFGEQRGKGKRDRDCVCQYQEILQYVCQKTVNKTEGLDHTVA